ncbi:polymeric immunoglobulin receptor-like [Megalobrama amblycephala]|uniref:polymeric immunoglobulin receptor-like n=1 Tax=Megalobrama amblycephala TaxID=75352 RepID=UPI002013ED13|nr:polymeric immunoglobulin receptor-like [Megalobrama amblycephala]
MKTFIFFTICMIKGHMGNAADSVPGIVGGSVIINCIYGHQNQKTRESAKSFCKVSGSECTTMTEVKNDLWIPEERFSMTDDKSLGLISVFIRNLTVNDSGTYRCKADSATIQEVYFNVEQEPCCGRSEDQTAYILTTAVIRCKYPEKYKEHSKLFLKVQNGSLEYIITAYGDSVTSGRFSLNVNEQEHVFTVNITGVSRRDAGVYFCGVHSINLIYTPLFTEIHLHVSASVVIIIILVLLLIAVPLIIVAVQNKESKGLLSSSTVEFYPVFYEQIKDTGLHCNPEDRDTITTVVYSCVDSSALSTPKHK